MSREILTLDLQRQEKNQPWGFRIIGGTDEALLLKVYKVSCFFLEIIVTSKDGLRIFSPKNIFSSQLLK